MKSIKILYFNSPKYDLITALHIEGLLKQNHIQIRFTDTGNYAPPDKVLNDSEIIDFANNEAEVIILGSRTRPLNNKIDLFWEINRNKQFFIKMEGGDESALDCSISEFFKFDLIFKREIFKTDWSFSSFCNSYIGGEIGLNKKVIAHKSQPFTHFHSLANNLPFPLHIRNILRNFVFLSNTGKVFPFLMGIEDRFIGQYNPKPKYMLNCIMRPHSKIRETILEKLNSNYGNKVYTKPVLPSKHDIEWMRERGAFSNDYYQSQKIKDFNSLGIGSAQNLKYLDLLNDSRATIAIPGGGFDTLRAWEALAQGSLLIAKKSTLVTPKRLIEGKHYLSFDNLDQLFEIIEWVFNNTDIVDAIRKKGQEYALKYHNSQARAENFLKIIDSIIKK